MNSFDTRLFIDVNRFAAQSSWAHGLMRGLAVYAGLLLLAALVLWAWWRARGGSFGGGSVAGVADVLFVPVAALVALGLAQPIVHLVGRQRPYFAIHQHVELLVSRATSFSFPSGQAVVAGACIVAIWLGGDRLVGTLSTLAGLLLACARVYVGANYPGDVVAGIVLGAVVALALRPAALTLLAKLASSAAHTPSLRWAIGGGGVTPHGPGPAATPERIAESGAVRLLKAGARPVPHVVDSGAPRISRDVTPARAHVTPSGRLLQPAGGDLREARDSGRRGAAGSAGDL